MRHPLLVVRLDDPRCGGGPGVVIAHVDDVAAYLALATDRDGARDRRLRLWSGPYSVGARVDLGGGR